MKFWRIGLGALLSAIVMSPAHSECSLGKMAELPVTMRGLQPMVTAKINGADAQFMADSGAFFSVITPGNAAAFHLPLGEPPFNLHLTGVGGDASVSVATVKNFMLGDVPLPNIQFIVGGSEVGSAGVIGQNIWGFADVEYDLPHGAIRLMKARGCGHANLAYWAGSKPYSIVHIEDRSTSRSHTVGTVAINGVNVRATFDTGAGRSILSLATAARLGIKPDSPGVVPAGWSGGIGRKRIQTWIAPIASFKTDGEEIRNLHLLIGDLGPDIDMLIGADFFIAHRVYVANSEGALFFTYEGGPVFDTRADYKDERGPSDASSANPPASEPEPTDAAGFGRRGAVFAARRDYTHAIADFSHAITLAPTEPDYPFQRALAYLAGGQRQSARDDLDAVLKLRPDDVSALLLRAQMRIGAKDKAGALDDLATASQAAPKTANERLEIGELFTAANEPDRAIPEFDLWIAGHPDDSHRPDALNGRCWSRALAGRDLPKALSDCDAAVRARPKDAGFLDSRGLVHLRLGDADAAIADYDRALEVRPGIAWSLYGRGLAKLRKGQTEDGNKDIAAATAIAPELAARAKTFGIIP